MIAGKKIVVVMPAYNAARTLAKTYVEVMAQGVVDLVILVDDASQDETVAIARELPATLVHAHPHNLGYGGNQKSCYRLALAQGADIVVMIHPDYQYTPKLLPSMAWVIANGLYPCVLASRILGGYAVRNGMPLWRYVANRFLTLAGNLLLGSKLSEFHTGYRAYSKEVLQEMDLESFSDDFIFDNQILAQILWKKFSIGEITCPTRYAPEASSINFWRSVKYGFGCLGVALRFRLAKMHLISSSLFPLVAGGETPAP